MRIGYVSPDFRAHAVAFFLTPLLEAHENAQCEIFCYSDVRRADGLTQRMQRAAGHWRDVRLLSHAQLAERVRHDGIDVLVDLAMHTAHNRLQTFARKPAPVQVSWLAYAGSAGLEAIDWRLTDANIDPVGGGGDGPGGAAFRLPDSWCCYAPVQELPGVSPLPAERTGAVTFGSLNQFCKINPPQMRCWIEILRAVPDARLIMICPAGQVREQVRAFFSENGISAERVELIASGTWPDYTRLFSRIDLALDSHPYNGMTTTCHSLWMGVPVVTRTGKTSRSRTGASLLRTVGLPEFVAADEADYIGRATQWARDLPRLAELRRTLRSRMGASPLMDAPHFARQVESAYRTMWRRWCGR